MSSFESDAAYSHSLFDAEWYLEQNPDVAQAGVDPFEHYMTHGWHEGRDPHPLFDTSFYLESNPDVAAAGENPLVHYELFGRAEQRATRDDANDGSSTLKAVPPKLIEFIPEHFDLQTLEMVTTCLQIIQKYQGKEAAFPNTADAQELCSMISARHSASTEPIDVSVVIPVHNALIYTLTCIYAIVSFPSRLSIEILVADDASTDGTAELIASLDCGIRVVRNESNLGFLKNCNNAAALARGRHLLFLNNDTISLPGWIDHLVDVVENGGNVGVVGARLLNADGTLQEAGGIVWRDGSAWNFGRNQCPTLPQFSYLKEVDYCSGAVMMVPREIWRELRGFDPLYEPAYCEDSDFFFRARQSGYRTLYQPLSIVIHHEGRSHGRDETKGLKAYQSLNQRKFLSRWSRVLADEHFPNGNDLFLARDRSHRKRHILVVDHYVPQWDRDAGSRTIFHFLKAFLEKGFQITFWPDNLHLDEEYVRPLQQLGVEVIYGPEYLDQFEPWMTQNGKYLDLVLLSRPHISLKYVATVRNESNARILYYGHDLHWLRMRAEWEVTRQEQTLSDADMMRKWETDLAELSDLVLYPSQEEAELVRSLVENSAKVVAVPAWLISSSDLADASIIASNKLARQSKRLLFVGGFGHSPNVDGVLWFVREVFAILRSIDPSFTVTIVGSNAPPEILELASEGVDVVGRVSDERLHQLYLDADVALIPLRYGGGVKGKLIEAFSKGVPVVTTLVGVQGIPNPERLAFVCDTASAFADALVSATTDRHAANRKANEAISFLRDNYTSESFFRTLGLDKKREA